MKEKPFFPGLTITITYIIVKIVYKLTGFSYSLLEGILNIKILVDLGLWIIVYVFVKIILNKLKLVTSK